MKETENIEKATALQLSSRLLADRFVLFVVNGQKFAVPMSTVHRVILAVSIQTIAKSPASILGIINLNGEAVPVVNFRRKFGFRRRDILLTDKLFILQSRSIKIALLADEVLGTTKVAEQNEFPLETLMPGQKEELSGMINFRNELIMIYDIEKIFLADAEKTYKLHQKGISEINK